ncbi:E3 ubiquitin-protein ligase UHRF1 [Plutella xylostella]|uniref:E3 ubiquitin-protein ligase UHRF1 n=1 Tax=Plutella xylostella TaxID=51655 RepID=UPI002032C191|nr:E3 ubiquitin-protein ligase UHRF1 [Plutella xylostella]
MHVRVRLIGKPEAIVVVESKLTKIEQFRKIIRDKFNVEPKLQRLLYGGKLLENGYTFHDYNIKLNDVIQLMVRAEPIEEPTHKSKDKKQNDKKNKKDDGIIYEDAQSRLYSIGDLIDMKDREQGAWFEGKIVRIVKDPSYIPPEPIEETVNTKEDSENEPPSQSSSKSPPKKKGIAEYFSKMAKLSTRKKQIQNTQRHLEEKNSPECGLLYTVHLDAEEDPESKYYCKLKEIRPRSRHEIDINDLEVGRTVMINHNTESALEKGYWYDFKVDEIKKLRTSHELIGTLYLGPDAVPQNDTKVRVHDKIFAIEETPLPDRSEEYRKMMVTPTERKTYPLNCLKCRDNEEVPCKECGCYLCFGKNEPEKIILCDECNNGYHMHCLSPPLSELPDEDWYCPSCKRDDVIVAPGAAKQTKKTNASKTNRDWGRGMACVGKTKTCAMPANHFGPIPGIEVGMCWRFRIQLSESGVHRPPVSGIHGRDVEGAYSIVLSGGYEDDYDNGDEFTYTGSGGRDLSGNKRTAEQSCDQTLTRENKALARNCAVKTVSEEGGDAGAAWRDGRPVRVVRSFKMMKHFPEYAPKEGIRYDGIYKVVKYYPETGKSGFRVWKYLLRRDDPNPAPWEEGAKEYAIVYPDGYLEAEAEKKALKEKGSKAKAKGKGGKKRALRESNHSSDSEEEKSAEEASPPTKKRKKADQATPEQKKRGKAKKGDTSITESPKVKTPSIFEKAAKGSPKAKKNKVSQDEVENVLSNEELEAIKADSVNAKLWEGCVEICKTSGKTAFVENVTTVFLCIICQDVPANPVTTPCLHNFCMGCIKLAFKSTGNKTCPACRGDLSKVDLEPNSEMKAALQTIMPGYDAGRK